MYRRHLLGNLPLSTTQNLFVGQRGPLPYNQKADANEMALKREQIILRRCGLRAAAARLHGFLLRPYL